MIDMMHAEQKVDVFGFVAKIREQRSQLIQTDVSRRRFSIILTIQYDINTHCETCSICSVNHSTRTHLEMFRCAHAWRVLIICLCVCVFSPQMQYSFIYQALLEYYLYGDTELDVSSLEGHLHKLHNTVAPCDRVGLEEEFKVSARHILVYK